MSQHIVGLDLGSYSIKIVELTRDLRNPTLIKAFEARIPLDPKIPPIEAQTTVLEEQFVQENLPQKNVICAFPGHQASVRIFQLPISDRKKLEKMLPFEMETFIPVDLEDVQLDWEILSNPSGAPNHSQILAVALIKERFVKFMNALKHVDIEPREVTLDSLSLAYLGQAAKDINPECIALMDCGHAKTNLCIVYQGAPIYTRSLGIAGREITRAIEQDFKLSFLEAETLKQTDGVLVVRSGPGVTQDAERISKCIRRVVDDLAAEIRQTFLNCEEIAHKRIDEIHLFGGSAKLKNLASYLSGVLELPVKRLNYFSQLNIQDFSDEQSYSLHGALALALRGIENKPNKHVNFRKGEFRSSQSFESAHVLFSKLGTWVGLILLFLILNFSVRGFLLYSKAKSLEKDIQKEVAKVLPDYKYKGPRQALSALQDRLSGSSQDGSYGKISQGKSPLIVIRNISESIPQEISLTLTDLNVDLNAIRLEGNTGSRESVAKIRESLASNPDFHKVSEDKVQKNPDGSFQFTFSVSLATKGGE